MLQVSSLVEKMRQKNSRVKGRAGEVALLFMLDTGGVCYYLQVSNVQVAPPYLQIQSIQALTDY